MTASEASRSVDLYKEVYGGGDPILCLHGLGANIYTWRHFIGPFSQKNKLILVDFRGCGKSPKPRDTHYSLKDKVDDIYDLILADDLRNLTLVGNSLGGAIAMLLAIRFRQERSDRLLRLVLIDSAADQRHLPPHLRLLRSILGAPIIYLSPSRLTVKMTLRMCYYERTKITREQVEAYAAPLASLGGRHALLQTARRCIPTNADELIAAASTVTVPTFIVWGREDRVIPLEAGERLNQLIPNSTLEVIDECGHIPHEEKPEETIERISRFLAATS